MEAIDIQWAWAAGLFEGEGSVSRQKGTRSYRLTMTMTDKDVVDRFHAIVGYGSIYGYEPKGAQRKFQWRWHCARASEVLEILERFLPLLGERRKAKALEALESVRNIVEPKPVVHGSHNTYQYNKCRCTPCREANTAYRQSLKLRTRNSNEVAVH